MRRLVAMIATWVAAAGGSLAAAEKPPLEHRSMGVANGCFVETVAFLDGWQQRFGDQSWARMLQWGAKEEEEGVVGHAVGVGDFRGKLWCWDINYGWRPVPVAADERENVESVAAPILTRYPKITARYPTFRFDFPQPATETLPVAQPGHENASIRDASIVGERLGRHRPVNVVRFTYLAGDEKREAGAVAFVFHGRYCIYSPEVGTVPFRFRGSVQNLRLIQQALRRLLPGVGVVQRL